MSSYVWPSEDGWPYPDTANELSDPASEVDDDDLCLRLGPGVLAPLDPLERTMISARYGVGGARMRSMGQLHAELGLPSAQLRSALGSGLAKLRRELRG